MPRSRRPGVDDEGEDADDPVVVLEARQGVEGDEAEDVAVVLRDDDLANGRREALEPLGDVARAGWVALVGEQRGDRLGVGGGGGRSVIGGRSVMAGWYPPAVHEEQMRPAGGRRGRARRGRTGRPTGRREAGARGPARGRMVAGRSVRAATGPLRGGARWPPVASLRVGLEQGTSSMAVGRPHRAISAATATPRTRRTRPPIPSARPTPRGARRRRPDRSTSTVAQSANTSPRQLRARVHRSPPGRRRTHAPRSSVRRPTALTRPAAGPGDGSATTANPTRWYSRRRPVVREDADANRPPRRVRARRPARRAVRPARGLAPSRVGRSTTGRRTRRGRRRATAARRAVASGQVEANHGCASEARSAVAMPARRAARPPRRRRAGPVGHVRPATSMHAGAGLVER